MILTNSTGSTSIMLIAKALAGGSSEKRFLGRLMSPNEGHIPLELVSAGRFRFASSLG
jgi:hypothetical protein